MFRSEESFSMLKPNRIRNFKSKLQSYLASMKKMLSIFTSLKVAGVSHILDHHLCL